MADYLLRGRESWRNPFDDYRQLRDDSPAHRVDHPQYGEFWVLSRFADVFNAARDTETFSSAQGLTPDADAMAMFDGQAAPIVMMDPPEHTAMRRLVAKPMTPRRVAPVEPEIQAFVDAKLDAVADTDGPIDIIEALFKPLPSFVVSHYLGVPVEDRERFDRWTNLIVAANADGAIENAMDAALELFGYATELIERRKADPGDDLVTDLVQAAEADEGQVTPEWIVGFVFTMVTGGNDTTTGLLGGTAEMLTERRDQRQMLLDDPSLIRPAVNEFLRLSSPVQNLARTTTRPVELHGETIPEGIKVMLLYGAANRDEREFGPEAETLDVQRPIDRILSLGYGAHHCLGAAAARLQAAIAIERLLDRFPDFAVDADQGVFANGSFVRRYESLPFSTTG
ncbi:MAG: cytochrome P450 [Acidimicrobiales bacterium]|nr:cytochrome P450 [Acidimicrobiales bacterium]